jgi:hypothetical protein
VNDTFVVNVSGYIVLICVYTVLLCGVQPKVSTRISKKKGEEADTNAALAAVASSEDKKEKEEKEDFVYKTVWIKTPNVKLPTTVHFPLPSDSKQPEELLEGQRGVTGLIRPVTPEQVQKVQASFALHNNEFDTSHPVLAQHCIKCVCLVFCFLVDPVVPIRFCVPTFSVWFS